ncbi:MAG: NAD(P)-dependent dehydrogenase (short-subunit alcohol dehydrogenase family) [Porticoccaceae bacterium]|jgi:NAD(P)-dependent dehydrogenase (short-subunit alcohol dehydrogenase family)|tara:strand:+ start:3672 stop:4505 length:834 start_codon:yes stop_codon:yes gene_type:complete
MVYGKGEWFSLDMTGLNNKIAIVTGAGHPKGIGRAICRQLAEAGVNVAALDLADAVGLDKVAQELSALGVKACAVQCDITSPTSVSAAIQEVQLTLGPVDLLVNNAGVAAGVSDFLKIKESDWDASFAVNLRGVVNMCTAVIPGMIIAGGGAIVNIASLAGLGAIEGIPANYTASKFAVVGLTKQLALQYASQGIRVNAICPGSIVTQMYDNLMQRMADEYGISLDEAVAMESESIPIGYSANPSQIGHAVVFLASEKASYMTGVCMPITGGMSQGL